MGFKGLLSSKTFWGAVAALAGGVLGAAGVDVDNGRLTEGAEIATMLFGFVFTVYGRVTASDTIDRLF